MNEQQYLVIDRDERGVALVTLNRPDVLNAMTPAMHHDLLRSLKELDRDEDVRSIVVTGSGRAFCAGADLSAGFGDDVRQAHEEQFDSDDDEVDHLALWRLATPIIGAINGAAVGVGLSVSLLFDVTFVAADAKLGFVFTRRGIMAENNALWLLPRLIGMARSMDLLLSGRWFSGREAAEIGLFVEAVEDADQVLPRALDYARDLAANTAPLSVALVKRLGYEFLEEPDRVAALRRETDAMWFAGEQPDAEEGITAFFEKRAPKWTGSKHQELPGSG